MFKKLCCAAGALLSTSSQAHSAAPSAPPAPSAVTALEGCWEGRGAVMGKPVVIAVTAKPIVQDAMMALDAESSAVADPKDRYSAHLIFGGTGKRPGTAADRIVGFWADSFGGAFTAVGQGESRHDGFDITYRYPDDAFVNRWRRVGDRLTWEIVARDKNRVEKPFANYSLNKAACRSPTGPR